MNKKRIVRKNVSAKISQDAAEKLENIAQRKHFLGKSQLIRVILENYVEQYE